MLSDIASDKACPDTLLDKVKAYHVAGVALLLSLVGICLIGYWYVCPYNIFKFTAPIKVLDKQIRQGDWFVYEMAYCKAAAYSELQADVQLLFIDHVVQYTPVVFEPLETGCHTIKVFTQAPELPPGPIRLSVVRTYHPNPVRWIT